MDIIFLCVIIFLFLLAVFDLSVGVSNDAVNFLNSAIGSKAAPIKRILIVASIGVFIGAAMSNGMMDIARHGIFRPEHFSFYDLICIFMAVMVTDIILLDVFNNLGMPTSTTVSMVFELLGATFVVAIIKMASDTTDLGFSELLNTEKALTVILGIFLSVAVAFVFGTVVQFLARTVFTFNYKTRLKWNIGIFGGVCATAIVYFLLIKGMRDLTFMTPEVMDWINRHSLVILSCCFVGFTLLMQLLHAVGVNVLKVIVLMGTFALAMAFAGNDLVNFIGVPLTGFASYQDYLANGAGDSTGFMMNSLNAPSDTSIWFLVGAGVIMVVALATSRKAQRVSQTEVGLGSQGGGDEMFGASRLARALVRGSMSVIEFVRRITPARVRRWFNRRFNVDETIMDQGASFDLVRASVNLVLAGALIAMGTSLKLPLSTTFVTFMVAMGTSLADRAWGRESAVFRITGVMSVIGGWFLTAIVAFFGAGIIVLAMHYGGRWVMILLALATVAFIIASNRRFKKKAEQENSGDELFRKILANPDRNTVWPDFLAYLTQKQQRFLLLAEESFRAVTEAFRKEDLGTLSRLDKKLQEEKLRLKNDRRKETLCLRRLPRETALEKTTWFYLGNNCCMSILYNLRRITEICKEHTQGNFLPLPQEYVENYELIRTEVTILFNDTLDMMNLECESTVNMVRLHCDRIKDQISDTYHHLYQSIRDDDQQQIIVLYVYLNMLQETREMVASLRKYIRSLAKMRDNAYSGRPAARVTTDPDSDLPAITPTLAEE